VTGVGPRRIRRLPPVGEALQLREKAQGGEVGVVHAADLEHAVGAHLDAVLLCLAAGSVDDGDHLPGLARTLRRRSRAAFGHGGMVPEGSLGEQRGPLRLQPIDVGAATTRHAPRRGRGPRGRGRWARGRVAAEPVEISERQLHARAEGAQLAHAFRPIGEQRLRVRAEHGIADAAPQVFRDSHHFVVADHEANDSE
jgi:hypothetical protein